MEINLSYIKIVISKYTSFKKIFLGLFIFFTLLSVFQTIKAPKLYSATVELAKNDYESAPTQTDNSLSSLARIVGGGGGSNQFYQVIRRVHSMQVAAMMEEIGYMDKYFNSIKTDNGNIHFPRSIKTSHSIAAFFLGYELEPYLNTRDLRDFFQSKVKISLNREQTEITLTTFDSDPDRARQLLKDLIFFTDKSFRVERLDYTLNQKAHFYEVLEKSSSVAIREQYIDQLVQLESKIASLNSNLPYVVKYVDEIEISKTPVSPRISNIFIKNLLITIFLYFIYATVKLYWHRVVETWNNA